MPRTVLATVGTSLFGNAARSLGRGLNEAVTDEELGAFLEAFESKRASAETNALSHLDLQAGADGDQVVLLYSETDDCRQCAEALARYYQAAGIAAKTQEIKGLVYAEADFAERGLRSLVRTLAHVVRQARRAGREPILSATGGFKAEIAYATLVGLLLDVPVTYIHEKFARLITLPPAPVGWDLGLLDQHAAFFEWMNADLRDADTGETRSRLAALPSSLRALVEQDDGCLLLTPMGEAYWEAYRDRVEQAERGGGTPLRLSPQAWEEFAEMAPETQQTFRRVLDKLRIPELRRSQVERVRNNRALIFPQGHVNERVFFVEQDGEVRVLALARHGTDYDRLIARGVAADDSPEAYRPLPPAS